MRLTRITWDHLPISRSTVLNNSAKSLLRVKSHIHRLRDWNTDIFGEGTFAHCTHRKVFLVYQH